MNSHGLFSEIKKRPLILIMVVLAHLGVALLLGLNLSSDDRPPMPAAQKHDIINAVAVDAQKFDEREKKKKLDAQRKITDKKLAAKKLAAKKAEKKKADDKKKKLALKKKKQDAKKAADIKRKKAEDKKKIAVAKKKKADKLAADKKVADKKIADKKAADKKAADKLEKQRLENERLAAEKKRKEEERIRREQEKADFERELLEEELREEQARKQAAREARLQTLREQYIIQLAQKVENNWLRPVATKTGQSCEVIVMQTMSGDVIDVRVQACTSDNAFQRSVERAVRKASPLPLPSDPELFDREIYFKFKPRI